LRLFFLVCCDEGIWFGTFPLSNLLFPWYPPNLLSKNSSQYFFRPNWPQSIQRKNGLPTHPSFFPPPPPLKISMHKRHSSIMKISILTAFSSLFFFFFSAVRSFRYTGAVALFHKLILFPFFWVRRAFCLATFRIFFFFFVVLI